MTEGSKSDFDDIEAIERMSDIPSQMEAFYSSEMKEMTTEEFNSKLLIQRFKCIAKDILENNGGPIDESDTIDGNEYVMVLKSDFEKLESIMNEVEDGK